MLILWISDFNEPVNLSIKLASDVSLKAKKQMKPLFLVQLYLIIFSTNQSSLSEVTPVACQVIIAFANLHFYQPIQTHGPISHRKYKKSCKWENVQSALYNWLYPLAKGGPFLKRTTGAIMCPVHSICYLYKSVTANNRVCM